MDDAPAAAQISQADIIERQAETIAHLKHQVYKGNEYKQLTKSKLKEAAARLKEYRLRLETLLQVQETLKQQLETEQVAHAKLKKLCKNTPKSVEAQIKPVIVQTIATQTDEIISVTRTSQTQWSGDIAPIVDRSVDEWTPRKGGRGSSQNNVEQSMPQLSRHALTETITNTCADSQKKFDEHLTTLEHESSAMLDAALASSDSDDENGNALKIPVESDQDLVRFEFEETSKSNEDVATEKKEEMGFERSFLSGVDDGVQRAIDQELESSSEDEGRLNLVENDVGANDDRKTKDGGMSSKLDPVISNEIDKELEFSSDEDGAKSSVEKIEGETNERKEDTDEKQTLVMSIDDALDDEFAALESEEQNVADDKVSLSLSSTSDSDSSDSSDSDSEKEITPVSDADKIEPSTQLEDDRKKEDVSSLTRDLAANDTTLGEESIVSAANSSSENAMQASSPDLKTVINPKNDHENTKEINVIHDLTPIVAWQSEKAQHCQDTQVNESEVTVITNQSTPLILDTGEVKASPSSQKESTSMTQSSMNCFSTKIRKADEAELPKTFEECSKKIKISSESTCKSQTFQNQKQDERQITKSLNILKQAMIRNENEIIDKDFTRRTLTVLAKQSAVIINTRLDNVKTLCHFVADRYRELHLSPLEVINGALSIFRTPRSRHLMQERQGLGYVYMHVLLRLVWQQDGPDLSLVNDCLLHLETFLFEDRATCGNAMSSETQHVQLVKSKIVYDKAFVAHIWALWTYLCRATTQLTRARVMLFDLVREYPDIRGLYWAAAMVEVYPLILEQDFDSSCVERQGLIKETLCHVLVTISSVGAARQEMLLHQSSVFILHRIVNATQRPELEIMDAPNPSFVVKKLLTSLEAFSVDYFELAKCLELCVAVFGLDVVTTNFTLEKCQELYCTGSFEVKSGIVTLVGHIAKSVAWKTSDTQQPRSLHDHYVECVLEWLYQLLSNQILQHSDPDNQLHKLVTYSSVAIELVLEYSAPAGLVSRRRVLAAIVEWFTAIPSHELMELPATFLRRLRFAVIAARPSMNIVSKK
ncbi:hypothetical protein Plhal703r1_c04g0020601 [Plasmopara halstedii]